MAPDLPGVVVRVQEGEEVWEEALAGWEVTALALVPVVIVSAPVAERDYHIR